MRMSKITKHDITKSYCSGEFRRWSEVEAVYFFKKIKLSLSDFLFINGLKMQILSPLPVELYNVPLGTSKINAGEKKV